MTTIAPARRPRRKPAPGRIRPTAVTLAEDYDWLRRGGMTHEAIANVWGLTEASLRESLAEVGYSLPTSPELRPSARVVERLIAQGATFSFDQIPCRAEHRELTAYLARLVREGRLVIVGKKTTNHGHAASIYRGIPREDITL